MKELPRRDFLRAIAAAAAGAALSACRQPTPQVAEKQTAQPTATVREPTPVPQPPTAMVLLDVVPEAGCGLGGDVARIDMEPLQHRLGWPGELLDGIHDENLVPNPQVLQQCLVGKLVDAGLVASQVDRHAIGRFVVDRLPQTLAGGHGFSASSGCDVPVPMLRSVPSMDIIILGCEHWAAQSSLVILMLHEKSPIS